MLQLLITFNLIKKIKIFLLFGFIANLLLAQNTFDLNFKNIEPDQIGVKQITGIYYSKKYNFLWLNTNEGLGFYNGYYYKKLIDDKDSTNRLKSKNLAPFYEDKNGILWFGYYSGAGISNYNYETKKTTHFDSTVNKIFNTEYAPSEFYEDNSNNFWIATWGIGLIKYNKVNKTYTQYNQDYKFTNNAKLPSNTVRNIIELEKNKYLLTFFEEQVARPAILDVEKNILTPFPINNYTVNVHPKTIEVINLQLTIIHHTLYDKEEQKIWFCTYSGLIVFDLKNKTCKRISARKFNETENLNLEDIRHAIISNDGKLWCSTSNSGIMVVDRKTNKAFYHKQPGNCQNCVGDNFIYGFTQDKENNIWVSSASKGLSVCTPYSQHLKSKNWEDLNLDYSNSSNQSVPVHQISLRPNCKLYISSMNGISIYDYKKDSLLPGIMPGKTTYEKSVHTFRLASKHQIHLGITTDKKTHNSQFSVYDEKLKKITRITEIPHLYSTLFTNDTGSTSYYFKYYYNNLQKYNASNNSIDSVYKFPDEYLPLPRDGYKLSDSKFLFKTSRGGFLIFNEKDNSIKTYRNSGKFDVQFPDSAVYCYYYDNKKSLWIGANSGLYEVNLDNDNVINHTERMGLQKIPIYAVVKDRKENVWFAGSNELYKYDIKSNHISTFSKVTGIPNLIFNLLNNIPISPFDNENLFFATRKALIYFNPNAFKFSQIIPQISIFEYAINDSVQQILPEYLDLSSNQNNLKFKLITNQIFNPSAGTFSYQLIGIDDKIKLLKGNEIELQNLPPGEYKLLVKFKNVYNYQSNDFYYNITINKPFYLTWWFILIVILLISLIIYYSVKQREKLLLQKQELLEKTVKDRTQELVIKAKEITEQKLIIEEKQKEIVDSILYARRIQNALLASKSLLDKYLKNYFIYFNPKELVSGDFYWATELKNKFYFIIADSTGHGVPGAFMSLLNINFLNEAINEKGIENTDDILNYVRSKLILSLAEDGSQEGGKDGMDCSLLCFDFEKMELQFSCANNPIIIISNGQLTEYKADRMAVGKSPKDEISFSSTKLNLQPGDVIYALTDGFADQFGGPSGKKLKHKNLREYLYKISNKALLEQHDLLGKEFKNWKGNLEQIDDVCIVGVKV